MWIKFTLPVPRSGVLTAWRRQQTRARSEEGEQEKWLRWGVGKREQGRNDVTMAERAQDTGWCGSIARRRGTEMWWRRGRGGGRGEVGRRRMATTSTVSRSVLVWEEFGRVVTGDLPACDYGGGGSGWHGCASHVGAGRWACGKRWSAAWLKKVRQWWQMGFLFAYATSSGGSECGCWRCVALVADGNGSGSGKVAPTMTRWWVVDADTEESIEFYWMEKRISVFVQVQSCMWCW